MPKQHIIDVRPRGWETDPEDEFLNLAPLDYCTAQTYLNWMLFFKLPDTADGDAIVDTIKRGLEVTLSQCRQLCGNIEEHPDGYFCFHKKRESTVELHVQWLDGAADEGKYPTFDDLEKGNFNGQALGNLDIWSVAPMTYGEKPEAEPRNKPKVSAFKISFVRGGMVFMMQNHHYANDVNGWSGSMYQLADNCAAIWKSPGIPDFPPWDPACLDYSAVTKPPPETLVDGPISPATHPDHVPGQSLVFHLPKIKAAELKRLASSTEGNDWISTYDAYTAFIWRVLSKHRAKLFKPDLSKSLIWGEAVNMRTRLHDPAVAKRIQGNILYVPLSMTLPVPQLTAAEVISEAPLSKLAWYNRQLTKSATQANLEAVITQIAAVRDKTSLFTRLDCFPPMSNLVSDWRDSKPYGADFGFAKPYAFRHPFDTGTNGFILIYPARIVGGPAGEDEGNEIQIGLEKELTQDLLDDPEWNRYFEFRGFDAVK
ncbi:hypothetical protein G7054_g4301 [Neopestalotiopsis clavispora]|nr:hypothetical protein G7054_g4301 [Neopestalotiopsis clavispora]